MLHQCRIITIITIIITIFITIIIVIIIIIMITIKDDNNSTHYLLETCLQRV